MTGLRWKVARHRPEHDGAMGTQDNAQKLWS